MATNADLDALQAAAEAAGELDGTHRWPFGAHGPDWRQEKADASLEP